MIMLTENANKNAWLIHQLNEKWWKDIKTGEPINRKLSDLIMLAISELSEAFEGIRKDSMDNHLPHRKMEEVEIADTAIRLYDMCGSAQYYIDLSDDFFYKDASKHVPDDKSDALLCMIQGLVNCKYGIVLHMCYSYAKKFNLDINGAIEEKLEYNKTRIDHTNEHRALAGGKKF